MAHNRLVNSSTSFSCISLSEVKVGTSGDLHR